MKICELAMKSKLPDSTVTTIIKDNERILVAVKNPTQLKFVSIKILLLRWKET